MMADVPGIDSRESLAAVKEDKPQHEPQIDPSRWWFASSGFPLIAGTLGPVANAFSICALVRPWRQKFPPGSDLDKAPFIPDPVWLTAINAIQLAMAVIANLVLLLNMARKIRFSLAQPITIVTWYISSICLVALNATAAGPLEKQPEILYVWSQAFYYGIYAACLYFVCSSLMVVTFWGALKGHYSKDFQLTNSQRTLMLQNIMFLMYLLVGALVFSTIEGWPYLDAVYWADVTLFTVGFGDIAAQTPLGRALLLPYALVGVISLGLVIGSIRSLVLERAQRHLSASLTEKKRRKTLKRMMLRGKDGILVPVTDADVDGDHDSPNRSAISLAEYCRRKREFELMRKIQARAERKRRWMAMGISTTVWLILWLVGAAIFQQCELPYQGWGYFDGLYFGFVSLMTIGYGDVTPISPAGRSFFVIWSLMALPTMTVLISNAGDTVVKFIRETTDKVGTVTILPDEKGIKKSFRDIMGYFSWGQLFGDGSDIDESPPGALGFAEEHDEGDGDGDDGGEDEEEEEETAKEKPTGSHDREVHSVSGTGTRNMPVSDDGTQILTEDKGGTVWAEKDGPLAQGGSPTEMRWASTIPAPAPTSKGLLSFKEPPGRQSSSKTGGFGLWHSATLHREKGQNDINSQTLKMRRAISVPRTPSEIPRDVPADPHDYRVLLIDEIIRVTEHLKSHPTRKYEFHEWAWYLKLIGEDESRPETHKKAVPTSKKMEKARDQGSGNSTKDEPDKLQWSWVGSRSPLMSSKEEAEWILEKLEHRLAAELRAARDAARKPASHG